VGMAFAKEPQLHQALHVPDSRAHAARGLVCQERVGDAPDATAAHAVRDLNGNGAGHGAQLPLLPDGGYNGSRHIDSSHCVTVPRPGCWSHPETDGACVC